MFAIEKHKLFATVGRHSGTRWRYRIGQFHRCQRHFIRGTLPTLFEMNQAINSAVWSILCLGLTAVLSQGSATLLGNESVGCKFDRRRRREIEIGHSERILNGNLGRHLFVQQPFCGGDHGYSVESLVHRRLR